MLHHMNIVDKHRELVMCFGTGIGKLPIGIAELRARDKGVDISALSIIDVIDDLQQYGEVTPHISFKNFRGRKLQTAIPILTQISNAVDDVIRLFRDELFKR